MEVRLQGRQVDCQDPLVEKEPRTAWVKAGPSEYGFYSNVNPAVDHPRWSQATERRLVNSSKRKDADVQWLWRAGGVAVHGHGSEEVLLTGVYQRQRAPTLRDTWLAIGGCTVPIRREQLGVVAAR